MGAENCSLKRNDDATQYFDLNVNPTVRIVP